MSPKKVSAKPKAEAFGDSERKDMSNMLTQAKKTCASIEQKAMLQLYQSCSRFDPKKKELLNKWRADKTCSWVSQYTEVSSKGTEVEQKSVHGYGTMYCSHLFVCCFFLCIYCH